MSWDESRKALAITRKGLKQTRDGVRLARFEDITEEEFDIMQRAFTANLQACFLLCDENEKMIGRCEILTTRVDKMVGEFNEFKQSNKGFRRFLRNRG